jgi:acetyltransferase EpsM
MLKIIILGATGGCAELINLISRNSDYGKGTEILGCLDDKYKSLPKAICGVPILGGFNNVEKYKKNGKIRFITAIGSSENFKNRSKIISLLKIPAFKWLTLVDCDAHVSKFSKLSHGCVVYPGVYIGAHAKVGKHAVIQSNVTIGHGTVIGSFTLINSGVQIGGDCKIGDSCYLGLGALVRDHKKIGNMTLIAMGAVVVGDCQPNSLYAGVPALNVKS